MPVETVVAPGRVGETPVPRARAEIGLATHDGRGIVTVDGKKIFVAGALPGEEVRFQRRKSRRSYDEAELLEVLEASQDRIDARCEAYGRCGGCSMQHVSDEQQLTAVSRAAHAGQGSDAAS